MSIAAAPNLLTSATQSRSASETLCSHCRLPVPPGLIQPHEQHQFCCHGCETAYAVIHSSGLEGYYCVLDRANSSRTPAKVSGRKYAEFDDAVFHRLYCQQLADGLLKTELLLEGVHCAACVWLVEKIPTILPGVRECRIDVHRAAVYIVFDPSQIALSKIARTLDQLGYAAHPARGVASRQVRRTEDRKMLVRMAVAGACAGNIMLLFFALYAGMFEGIEHGYEQLFRWIAMLLNTVCLAWPGLVFARGAIAALRTRTINLDVPIALGLYLGGAWGIWKTISGSGDLYFDSITALVFFLLVGRFVQQRQQRFAADALELLFASTPAVAHRVGEDGIVTDVPSEALKPGDIVEVRAGDSTPADGTVLEGTSRVDLSLLTGESRAVAILPGETIPAGCVNIASPLRVEVVCTGESTRFGKLLRMVEDAAQRRAPIVRLADRWGSWLLWALLALAALTLAIWWHLGMATAIDRAAALLIATCPCGLGLATPMAMSVSIGRAARAGILMKGGDVLQSLADTRGERTIVLDKTGTLTAGRLSLVRWQGDSAVRAMVSALEAHSSHPAAIALHRDLPSDSSLVVSCIRQHPGAGISGVVDGSEVVVGNKTLMGSFGIRVSSLIQRFADSAVNDGLSPTFVSVDGVCVALAALGDPIRPDAASALESLRSRGWKIKILSGDHPEIVAAVGRSLGIDPADTRGGVSPEQKCETIRTLAQTQTVVMVGDGVNDAAALAAATVGIAVRGGAEASLAAADVSLSREGISPVLDLLNGARAAMRTIHWTIFSSIAYNVLAASLCVAGLISPLLAAFIMPASSFTVVAICLGSGAFKQPREKSL